MTKPGSAHALAWPLARILGALLLLAGMGLSARTEHGLALSQAPTGSLDQGRLNQAGLDQVAGPLQIAGPPRDPDFNQQAPTALLVRRVEMFQWRELSRGDAPSYQLDWAEQPLDASHYVQPAGHANPGAFPLQGKSFEAGAVSIDGYALAPALLPGLPGAAPIAPDMQRLPGNLAASFSLRDGYLFTSADPAHPRLGDLRVSWTAVPAQNLIVLAHIDGKRLVPTANAIDGKGYRIVAGDGLATLAESPQATPRIAGRRVLALLLAASGAWLALHKRPLPGLADAPLALAAGVLAIGVAAAIAWLGHGSLHVAVWLALAVLGLIAARWRLRARAT